MKVLLCQVMEVIAGFAQMEFPNCLGATDGAQGPILCPTHQAKDYQQEGVFLQGAARAG